MDADRHVVRCVSKRQGGSVYDIGVQRGALLLRGPPEVWLTVWRCDWPGPWPPRLGSVVTLRPAEVTGVEAGKGG